MQRSFSAAILITMAILAAGLFAGCGGGSNSGGGGSSVFVPGKWTVTVFSGTGQLFANTIELDMNLLQSGGTISSDSNNSIDSGSCTGMHVDSSAGTVSGDKFKLVFMIDSEAITLDGTLSADGKSITSGHVSDPNGNCVVGPPISFNAAFVPPLIGTLTGTLADTGSGTTAHVIATLVEDPTDFNLTGTMNITGDPCLSQIAIAADNPGLSIGSASSFEMTDGTNVVDFIGSLLPGTSAAFEFDGDWNVTSGCTEEFGMITLDPNDPAAMASGTSRPARASTHKINPLLVERMKNLMAARRAQFTK